MDVTNALAPGETLPVRCQRLIVPGELLDQMCGACCHLLRFHPMSSQSACLHCTTDWIAAILANIAEVVDPSA